MNLNRGNAPITRHTIARWNKGDSSRLQRQTLVQSEGMEDDTPGKWHPEKTRGSFSYIRQKKDN